MCSNTNTAPDPCDMTIEIFDWRYTYTNCSHTTTMTVINDNKTTWSDYTIQL